MTERASNHKRRTIHDFLLSACAFCALVVMLAALDRRVHDEMRIPLNPRQTSAQVAAVSAEAGTFAARITKVVKYGAMNHGPILIFVVAATALTIFMIRT